MDWNGKRVLVTGGSGFIGSHLVERLAGMGAQVTIYDNLMRSEESLRNLWDIYSKTKTPKLAVGDILDYEKMKKHVMESDVVVHFAALPSHRLALERPRDYALIDVIGTVNVLEAARLSPNKPSVVFGSSNKVYGKQPSPFREDMRPMPEGPYGQAKISSEEFCRQYSKYYGLNTPNVRFHHVIGPRCQPDLVLSIFTERIINDLPPILHGHFEKDGKFTPCAADFTNVQDAVTGVILAAEKVKGFDVLNLGTGKITDLLEMVRVINKILGKNVKPEFKELMEHESLMHCADTSKTKRVLGFEAKVPFEESVKQYVEWRLKTGERKAAAYR